MIYGPINVPDCVILQDLVMERRMRQVEFTGMGEPWKNKQFGNAKYHKQTSNLNSANSKRVAEDNFIQTKAFFPFSTKEQTRL